MNDEVEDMIEARRRAVEAGCKVPVILPVPEAPEPLPEEKGKSLANFSFKF